MRQVSCLCGAVVEAPGAAELSAAYWEHADAAHPGLQISARRRQDADDALLRMGGWDGVLQALPDDVVVRPLEPGDRDRYLAFFDNEAFCDNPAWASCYCLSYTLDMDPLLYEERTAAENRRDRADAIASGDASGVVAVAGDRMVGWCHAAPRTGLPLLDRRPGFQSDDQERTGSIVCFVVPAPYRGQGLARRLLDGACDMLRERGYRWLDAYPPKEKRSAAGVYHGTRSMFEGAGFEHVRDAGIHVVMRKAL
jgi:ribosomal protein S18 acetylase RimI-like enzyme